MSLIHDEFTDFYIAITVVVCLAIIVLGVTVVHDSTEYIKLKTDIPNMDCRELIMIHNKHDYWLDGDNDNTVFQRESLFDLWYNRILELRCVNP